MTLPVAILCGGLGTRLHPLTGQTPKALVEIHGEPFLAHQLRLLRNRGIHRVILCAGYFGEMIREFARDGSRFGLAVEYSFDGPALLGTAGAVRQAIPLLGETFFVLYGDSYLPCDYQAIADAFAASRKTALMTVHKNHGEWDTSNVELCQGAIRAYDKHNTTPAMQHIDYGLGAFHAKAFSGQHRELSELYGDLLTQKQLAAFEVAQRFYEIGSFQGIKDLTQHLSTFSHQFLAEAVDIIGRLDHASINRVVGLLADTRARGGRLFILGVGGSAANASHAVNDFRKIAGIEAYAPTDNVAELTARANDEGWASVFSEWLKISRLGPHDTVLVFSVGGGDIENQISPNLVAALDYARSRKALIAGVVGRDGGYTAQVADACVIVPSVNPAHVTPHAEAFQSVLWHLFVSHPLLKAVETKWESLK